MSDPIWVEIGKKELGVHATPGPESTARIIEYDQVTILKATSDEVAWCSSFVNWCIREARKTHPEIDKETESAAAISWGQWGQELPDGGQKCGSITVFQWSNAGHHVAMYLDEDDSGIICLGGNQGHPGAVCIKHFPLAAVLNFRWPNNYQEEKSA